MKECRSAARRLKGACEASQTYVRVRFVAGERPAEVCIRLDTRTTTAMTSVRVDMRGNSPGTFRVYGEGALARLGKIFGMQYVRVGDPRFDSVFVVKSNPASLAPDVFDSRPRNRLVPVMMDLSRRGLEPVLELTSEELILSVPGLLADRKMIVELAKGTKNLVERILRRDRRAAITWVAQVGRCPVCGTEMRERLVHCTRCKTPHHRDCWDYVSTCSTYACRETRSATLPSK